MIAFLLAALAVVISVRAHRSAARRDELALERARRRFAASLLAQCLLLFAASLDLPVPLALTLVAGAALAGIAGWDALSRLLAMGTRTRDLVLRIPLLAAAAIVAAVGGSWLGAAIVAGLGVLAFRWKRVIPTRRLFRLGLLALGLAFLGFARVGDAPAALRERLVGPWQAVWAFANTIRWTASFHASLGALALFLAFVRDPSLGVRTVGRRLALSHVLVVLVPLLLTGLLWAVTTVLGVSRDRALVAARTLESEGDALEAALRAALESGSDPTAALRTVGATWDARAPGARVWLRAGDSLVRVRGDAVTGEAGLLRWLDSLEVLPRSGMIGQDDGVFLGAAARAREREAVALLPADTLLDRVASRVADARVRLLPRDSRTRAEASSAASSSARRWTRSSLGVTAADTSLDSLELERVRRVTRRLGLPDSLVRSDRNHGRTRLVAGGESFGGDDRGSGGISLFDGYAMTRGLSEEPSGWQRSSALVMVSISPRRALSGLFENRRSDRFGYLPLVLIAVLGFAFGLVALWDVVMVTSMGRGVATAIGELHGAARRLEAGDLAHRIEVRGEDDLWDVARALNRAAAGLESAREAEKEQERMESELALARRIQARLLPAAPPRVPGLEVAGMSEPAREVGGDYFDHIDLGGGRLVVVIADVSGKGVGAALLMSGFRASLVSHDLAHADPVDLAARLNEFLHRSVDPGKFVTAFIGFLDAASGALHYVNAGHNPPVVLRADGSHEWLGEGGPILGILPGSVFTSGTATLEPGDLLALYTDGVTEGADAAGELWGEERLLEALRRLRALPCAEGARRLVTEVRAYEGESGPADDITVILARRA